MSSKTNTGGLAVMDTNIFLAGIIGAIGLYHAIRFVRGVAGQWDSGRRAENQRRAAYGQPAFTHEEYRDWKREMIKTEREADAAIEHHNKIPGHQPLTH